MAAAEVEAMAVAEEEAGSAEAGEKAAEEGGKKNLRHRVRRSKSASTRHMLMTFYLTRMRHTGMARCVEAREGR